MPDPARAVFLSYAREDSAAVQRLAEALRTNGVEVWFDQNELVGGDAWDAKIRKQIRECALFVPVISAQTQARLEGYFRLEWKLAAQRTHTMAEAKPFLLPVVIDATSDIVAHVPEEFRAVQWTRLDAGEPTAMFLTRVSHLLGATAEPAAAPATHRLVPPVAAPTAAPAHSIAVLPFANLSADPENEYFSDGMTEEIINALVQVAGLQVSARTSVFAFKGKADDLRTIAAKLNVRTVLEGSVRKAAGRIRITAQLINAADGYHLWSERYDRALDDIFAVQDEIARGIVEKLKVKLIGAVATQPLVRPVTEDLEAYQLYLQGRYFWAQRGAGLMKSLPCFEAALARDPNYALAHTGLADAYSLLAFYGYVRPHEVMAKARTAAERAVALDPNLAEAHSALGWIQFSYDWNLPAAGRSLQRATELKPTYAAAHSWRGAWYSACGAPEQGVACDEQAVRVEPLSLVANAQLGWRLNAAGRREEAARRLEHTLKLEPRYMMGHWLLGQAYLTLGRFEEGIAELRQAVELSGRLPWMVATLGCGLAHVGQKEEARVVLAELTRRAESEYVRAFLFAMLHAYLGEEDQAMTCLERAREERDLSLPYFIINAESFNVIGIPARYLSAARHAAFCRTLGIVRE